MKRFLALILAITCVSCVQKGKVTTEYDEFTKSTSTKIIVGQIEAPDYDNYLLDHHIGAIFCKEKQSDNTFRYFLTFDIVLGGVVQDFIKADSEVIFAVKEDRPKFTAQKIQHFGYPLFMDRFTVGRSPKLGQT